MERSPPHGTSRSPSLWNTAEGTGGVIHSIYTDAFNNCLDSLGKHTQISDFVEAQEKKNKFCLVPTLWRQARLFFLAS